MSGDDSSVDDDKSESSEKTASSASHADVDAMLDDQREAAKHICEQLAGLDPADHPDLAEMIRSAAKMTPTKKKEPFSQVAAATSEVALAPGGAGAPKAAATPPMPASILKKASMAPPPPAGGRPLAPVTESSPLSLAASASSASASASWEQVHWRTCLPQAHRSADP